MNVMSSLSRGVSREADYDNYASVPTRSGQPSSNERSYLIPLTLSETGPTKDRLFSALADMKVFFSQVAMHMDREWRDRLFLQLDRLHDPEEWDMADDPVGIGSFRTFLRMMFLLKPERPPGLALANDGHLLAHWISGRDRLTIECLSDDRLKVVFTRWLGEAPDRGAIMTTIDRLDRTLSPYDPSCWFQAH